MKIDINILTIMHPNLPRCHDEYTVFNTSDMSCACNMTSNYKAVGDVLKCKTGKWSSVGRRNRHVNNTSVELGK